MFNIPIIFCINKTICLVRCYFFSLAAANFLWSRAVLFCRAVLILVWCAGKHRVRWKRDIGWHLPAPQQRQRYRQKWASPIYIYRVPGFHFRFYSYSLSLSLSFASRYFGGCFVRDERGSSLKMCALSEGKHINYLYQAFQQKYWCN